MKDNQNVPQIRFLGFEKEYEKKQFDSVFDFISNNTLSRDNLNYHGGSTQNVHYGDILTKFGEYVDADMEMLPFLNDEEVALKYQNATLIDGDIIIADTAEDEMVGKCSEIGNIGDKKIVAGLHTIPCRPKGKYASMYMGYYLNSEAYHHKLLPLMQGVKVIAISKSGIQGTELCLSQDYDEQKKIGEFLFAIDKKIKYENQKLDAIKRLKKSMLTKMFPRDGQRKPEIRFAGFNDDWEQRKLEDLCSIITKQTGFDYSATIKPSLLTTKEDDTYSFIQNKDFEGMNINLDTDFYIPISVAERYPKITLDCPSLLISISGRIGNVGLYSLDSKAFIGGAVGICKLKNMEDGKTTLYELLAPSGQKYFNSLIKASSHANITVEDIRNIEVLLPKNEDEKKKINRYFDNLDNLITLHQRELEKLKNMKSACMKRMFV